MYIVTVQLSFNCSKALHNFLNCSVYTFLFRQGDLVLKSKNAVRQSVYSALYQAENQSIYFLYSMAGYLLRTVYPAGYQSFPLSSQIISARPKIVTESQSLVLFSLCMKLRKSFCFFERSIHQLIKSAGFMNQTASPFLCSYT